jgi:hypothetical protein
VAIKLYSALDTDIICTTFIEGVRVDFGWHEDMHPPTHYSIDYDGEIYIGTHAFWIASEPHELDDDGDLVVNWNEMSEDGHQVSLIGKWGEFNTGLYGELTLVDVEGPPIIEITKYGEAEKCNCADCRRERETEDGDV